MKPKILVVDDERDICEVIGSFLKKRHYEVVTASSGQEALEKLIVEKPDLVLLDIRMPHMDGIECLRQIKKLNNEALVIMVTCITDEDIAKSALKLGAVDYITKPLGFDALENAIATYLFLNSGK